MSEIIDNECHVQTTDELEECTEMARRAETVYTKRDKLFPVEVVEKEDRVKVHVGLSTNDE